MLHSLRRDENYPALQASQRFGRFSAPRGPPAIWATARHRLIGQFRREWVVLPVRRQGCPAARHHEMIQVGRRLPPGT